MMTTNKTDLLCSQLSTASFAARVLLATKEKDQNLLAGQRALPTDAQPPFGLQWP